jgi:ribosomal protein S18 acetylase RimI-like enzyme
MKDYVIHNISSEGLSEYCKIPISFYGNTIFEVKSPNKSFAGFILEEKPVETFFKDYDLLESPVSWPQKFDVSNWKFYLAMSEDRPVGGAALIINSGEIHMLEGKKDLACLWDIRVHPDWRGKGLGRELFQRTVADAKKCDCAWLKIETQNNNVAANKFYKSQGCHLSQIHLHAYYDVPECNDEAMLIWYLPLK